MRALLACLSIAAWFALATPALADDPSSKADDKDKINLPAMSPDKTVEQVIQAGGRSIRYKATVGHIDIHDEKGKTIGQVVYTAYIVPGVGSSRVDLQACKLEYSIVSPK